MSAWQCKDCKARFGTRLSACAVCRSTNMFEEGAEMPKVTVAGASNADAGPGESGHVPPVEVSDAAPAEAAVPQPQAPADPSARPAVNASKAAWVAYAVHHGLAGADAEAMKKTDLVAWTPGLTVEPETGSEAGPETGVPAPEPGGD